MTSLPGPLAAPSAPAEAAVDALAFHLDYLDAKLTAIGEQFAEDISAEHSHDLHSAWDEVQQARATLGRLRTPPTAHTPAGMCAGSVDFDEFTARWDRASEPISALLADRPTYSVAEWAAARARYELAFVEAVRPATRHLATGIFSVDVSPSRRTGLCRTAYLSFSSACCRLVALPRTAGRVDGGVVRANISVCI